MSEHHPLKTFLNIHLASDASAVLHLPFVLNSLTLEIFTPSPHLPKWIARVQSLLHSKDTSGRWAGLVLAQKTAILSQELLIDHGQSWVGAALPLLTRNDPPVVLKAAIRLLKIVFTHSYEVSEFRRQVATPAIPKLLALLVPLVEQTGDLELKVVAMIALVNLITLYPTLHKASYPALSNLALCFLDGHPHTPASRDLLGAASRLYSVIHVTGGKAGASSLWRKTLDETLAFGTNAFWSLRTTFAARAPVDVSVPSKEDPATFTPRQLDRLKCAITILDDLLGAIVYRPIQLPLGILVRFALQLLRTTDNLKRDGFVDPTIHTLEVSVIPRIQTLGCSLIISLSERAGRHLGPHLTQVLTALANLFEQHSLAEHRHVLLYTLETLIKYRSSFHSPLIATRLMKAVLPSVSKALASSRNIEDTEFHGLAPAKGRKGKKKAQNYEGDEIFSSTRIAICPTDVDRQIILTTLEVVRLLLHNPHLSAIMQSVSIRVVFALLLAVNRMPPASLSPDPYFFLQTVSKLHETITEVASGTSGTLSKSLPLVVTALCCGRSNVGTQRQLDLLLHPRLPPLMRSMPLAEKLALVFSEESDEEAELRRSLGLHTGQNETQQHPDVEMDNSIPQSPAEPTIHTSPRVSTPPKITSSAVQEPVLTSQSKGKEKAAAPLESIPTSVEAHLDQEQVIPYSSSSIEAPRPQYLQLPSETYQSEPSSSAPKASRYDVPTISAEDGDDDEEMPAINLDSDSDPE